MPPQSEFVLTSPRTIARIFARIIAAGIVALIALMLIGNGIQKLQPIEATLMVLLFLAVCGLTCLLVPPYSHRRRSLIGAWLSIASVAAFYIIHFLANGKWPGGWVFPAMFVPGLVEVLCDRREHDTISVN